jgi:hypothetical protein
VRERERYGEREGEEGGGGEGGGEKIEEQRAKREESVCVGGVFEFLRREETIGM